MVENQMLLLLVVMLFLIGVLVGEDAGIISGGVAILMVVMYGVVLACI